MDQDKAKEALKNNGFFPSRMISYSKSEYRHANPDNVIVFNANIFTESSDKIWWGDLDLTRDEEALRKASTECGETLYVLRELDGRFEHEKRDIAEVKSLAVAMITPHQTLFDLL